MKKNLFVILIFVFSGMVFANEKFSFSITPEAGTVWGKINEYVYYVPETYDGGTDYRKLSELNWDVVFISFVGAQLNLEMESGIFLKGKFNVGFPCLSGVMIDRDWQNCIGHYDENWLTNYSIHNNYFKKYFDFYFGTGKIFSFGKGFEIKLNLFCENNVFSFDGCDGYGRYGAAYPDNSPYVPHCHEIPEERNRFFSGNVISYEQNRFFAGFGFDLEKRFAKWISVGLNSEIRFVAINALDHHINTYTKYLDEINGFGGAKVGGNINFILNKKHKISFYGTYDWLPKILGVDNYASENSTEWDRDPHYLGGASSSLFSASINYTYSF